MASFSDEHRKWQAAQKAAAISGTRTDRTEAERLRQALTEHPAVNRARRQTDARPVR